MYSQRIQRIAEIEALGFKPYGHRFDFTHTIPQILAQYRDMPAEQLVDPRIQVRIAERVMTARRMGKAGFAHLLQNGEQLQIYVRKDAVSEKARAANGICRGNCRCTPCGRISIMDLPKRIPPTA